MIAALPMYEPPWLRPAHDHLWSLITKELRDRGVDDLPPALHRGGDPMKTWTAPSLLLGQTCGYPLLTRLKDAVQILATPHYAAEGCDGAYHRAAIIVRANNPAASVSDLRGKRAGINDPGSNTGMNLFRAVVARVADGPEFFRSVTVTGSHARSLAAIISGRIDVAAIDAVTLALLRDRYPSRWNALRIVDWTSPSPALPFITSARSPGSLVDSLRATLSAIVADPDYKNILSPLRLSGFSVFGRDDYQPLLAMEREAIARRYPVLN